VRVIRSRAAGSTAVFFIFSEGRRVSFAAGVWGDRFSEILASVVCRRSVSENRCREGVLPPSHRQAGQERDGVGRREEREEEEEIFELRR
jgi:hypothetical protein